MRLYNFALYRDGEWRRDLTADIQDDIIRTISEDTQTHGQDAFDCGGAYLLPGFVDLQVYGAGGHIFDTELNKESIQAIHRNLVKYGTTSFLITLPSTSMDNILQAIHVVRECIQEGNTGLAGLHIEGPYINPERKGAHNEDYLRLPTAAELNMIMDQGKDVVKMITIAPELFSGELLDMLLQSGILVSAGHSHATFNEAMQFFNKGISCCTHLFNAMSQLESRSPGLAGAVLTNNNVWSTMVADGKHVAFETLALACRLKPGKMILISDSTFLDVEQDEVSIAGVEIIRKDNAFYTKQGQLAGSAISLHQALVNTVRHIGLPLETALGMACTAPASLISSGNAGRITEGALANMVLLDQELAIREVFFQGRRILQ